jgi:predicted AlkP superfamily phosphohydrolase/phosphomutase
MEVDDPWGYMDGWIDLEMYMQQLSAHADWWGRATRHLLDTAKPDMLFSWIGTVDHIQHVLYGGIVPGCRVYDPKRYDMCMNSIREAYRQMDANVGRILEAVDLEETLVLLVSDHGFTHLDWNPFIKQHLAACGLLSYSLDEKTGEMTIDWSKTRCHPLEPCHAHIFINLKGRDPHGIVDPRDYKKVQQEIIEALWSLKNPETGETVVDVAIPKEKGNTLGVFEGPGFERVGDVLFALKPGYMANPFVYRTVVRYKDGTERFIPNLELFEPAVLTGNFTGCHLTLPAIPEMHCAIVVCGPGVRKGVRRVPADITDIAPTMAWLMGMPAPKDAEGGILHDVVEQER